MTNEECMGRLVVSATHDLRNALAVIRECAGLSEDMLRMAAEGKGDVNARVPRMLEALAQAQAQVRRGAALAESMGHLANSASGGADGGGSPANRCDLNRVVEDFCVMIARRGKACALETEACPAPEPVMAATSALDVFRDLLDVFDACAAVGGGAHLRLAPTVLKSAGISTGAVACEVVSHGENTDMVLAALTSCPLLRPARSGRDSWPHWLSRLVPGGQEAGRRFVLPVNTAE